MTGIIIFLIVTAISLGLFGLAVRKRYLALQLGRPDEKFNDHALRWKSLLINVLGQRKVLWEPFPGIMHLFIFWGFIILAPGEIQFFGEGLVSGFSLPLLGRNPYFYLLQDVFAVLVLIGLAMAFCRRYIVKLDRLDRDRESALIIVLISTVIITLLLGGAARAAMVPEGFLQWAPVVRPLVQALLNNFNAQTFNVFYSIFWWLHVLTILTFLAYIPRSKHLHLLASPFNVYFRSLEPLGATIKPIDFNDPNLETLGVNKIEDFKRKQLLDLYSCTKCGRCQDNCPAYLSDKPLSSKVFINKLKEHFIEKSDFLLEQRVASASSCENNQGINFDNSTPAVFSKELVGDVVSQCEIWSCTTCGHVSTFVPFLWNISPNGLS